MIIRFTYDIDRIYKSKVGMIAWLYGTFQQNLKKQNPHPGRFEKILLNTLLLTSELVGRTCLFCMAVCTRIYFRLCTEEQGENYLKYPDEDY